MAERSILFNDAMVRSILSGAKTQTRRVMRTNHVGYVAFHRWDGELGARAMMRCANETHPGSSVFCEDNRIGRPGDRLWVRECWCPGRGLARVASPSVIMAPSGAALAPGIIYRADGASLPAGTRFRPSIHMPRWASRLTLRVTEVRVERVQDITEGDARAEGVYPLCGGYCAGNADAEWHSTALGAFADLWCSTYGVQSWTANPWVWVVKFKREEVSDV